MRYSSNDSLRAARKSIARTRREIKNVQKNMMDYRNYIIQNNQLEPDRRFMQATNAADQQATAMLLWGYVLSSAANYSLYHLTPASVLTAVGLEALLCSLMHIRMNRWRKNRHAIADAERMLS